VKKFEITFHAISRRKRTREERVEKYQGKRKGKHFKIDRSLNDSGFSIRQSFSRFVKKTTQKDGKAKAKQKPNRYRDHHPQEKQVQRTQNK
jgi:hypothetical protein